MIPKFIDVSQRYSVSFVGVEIEELSAAFTPWKRRSVYVFLFLSYVLYSEAQIDWMIKNSNVYGLMPERIYGNGSDCSEASPLSWCNAEFAASVYEYSKSILK